MMNFKSYHKFIIRRPYLDYTSLSSISESDLCDITKNESFMEAIYYASPEFYGEVIKATSPKERMLDSMHKYLSRMQYRATPFGTFSACGVGEYGNNIYIPSGQNIKRVYKYDGQLLFNIKNSILKSSFQTLEKLAFKSNETIHRVGNYFYLWARIKSGEMELIKIPVTEILSFIIENCYAPISLFKLAEKIKEEYEIGNENIFQYIYSLCDKGILIDNATPETVGTDNLKRLETIFDENNNSIIKTLRNNLNTLSQSIPFNNKLNSIEALSHSLEDNKIGFKSNKIIQVDSYLNERAILPNSVCKSIVEIYNIYQVICSNIGNPLTNFINRYKERYQEESVNILEALNPLCGIGYHNYYDSQSQLVNKILNHSPKNNSIPSIINVSLSLIDQIILSKINEIGNLNIHKIILSNKDFKPFNSSINKDFPISFSAIFKIVGYNDCGPIISNISFSGPSAVSLITRFSQRNEEMKQLVNEIGEIEKKSNPDIILAEISHLTSPHSENVQSRPDFREFLIPISSLSTSLTLQCINPNDLFIKIKGNKLHLFSKTLNKEVLPCFTSAFNYQYHSSDLYKFLGDVQNQNRNRVLKPSYEGVLKILKHLPRIEYKNIIMQAECWLIEKNDLFTNNKFDIDKFKQIHFSKEMPRFLSFAQGDNILIIDIEDERSIKIFGKTISKSPLVKLEEFLPQANDMNHYNSVIEVVQPFIPVI